MSTTNSGVGLLGYEVSRHDLDMLDQKDWASLVVSLVFHPENYAMGTPERILDIHWSASKKGEDGEWFSPNARVDINTHGKSPYLAAQAIGVFNSLVYKWGHKYGPVDQDNKDEVMAAFEQAWEVNATGNLYGLEPSTLLFLVFPHLRLPRLVYDVRFPEYVVVDDLFPPVCDGWSDNNKLPEYKYSTIIGTVAAKTEYEARMRMATLVSQKMVNHSSDRYERWLAAGCPVISNEERMGRRYVVDPLKESALVIPTVDTKDRDNYVFPDKENMDVEVAEADPADSYEFMQEEDIAP